MQCSCGTELQHYQWVYLTAGCYEPHVWLDEGQQGDETIDGAVWAASYADAQAYAEGLVRHPWAGHDFVGYEDRRLLGHQEVPQ